MAGKAPIELENEIMNLAKLASLYTTDKDDMGREEAEEVDISTLRRQHKPFRPKGASNRPSSFNN